MANAVSIVVKAPVGTNHVQKTPHNDMVSTTATPMNIPIDNAVSFLNRVNIPSKKAASKLPEV